MTTLEQRAAAVAAALELVATGLSANKASEQIAQPLGTTSRTIKRWAQEAGTPLGEATQDAAKGAREAAEAQFVARRAELRVLLSDTVTDIIGRMHKPHIDFRGKEAQEVEFPIATSTDVRNYAVAAGILIDKMRLEEGKPTTHGLIENADGLDTELRGLLAAADAEARARVPE